ncbi:MAG: hypothetical protein ACLTKG_08835, partial [Collinsella intestinalis]
VYYSSEMDGGKQVYKAQVIPARGAWLEFEVDKRDQLVVSIDRKRKQSATMFLRALGIAVTNDEIFELLGDSDVVKRTIERDTALTREDALIEIYRRLRPGEPPTVDASRSLLEGLLFNPQRYDLARVGRYKVNKKLNLTTEEDVTVLTDEDIIATLRYLRPGRGRARLRSMTSTTSATADPHRGRAGGQPVPHRHDRWSASCVSA